MNESEKKMNDIDIEKIMEEIRARAKEIKYTSPVSFEEIPVPALGEGAAKVGIGEKIKDEVRALAYRIFGANGMKRIREMGKKNPGDRSL